MIRVIAVCLNFLFMSTIGVLLYVDYHVDGVIQYATYVNGILVAEPDFLFLFWFGWITSVLSFFSLLYNKKFGDHNE